jgi:hypothetical protein
MLTRRIRGFCVVRDLRNFRVHSHRSLSPRYAARGDPWGHEKDIVANRWPDARLYHVACRSDH